MPYFFVLLATPIGVAIALYRRNPRRFLDGPTEDASARLVRWAVSLLSPQRAEWGQAMLGELAHLDGRVRRMRFALGCTGAALVLPPWGRAAAGLWATIALAAASLGIYTGMAVAYQFGIGGWIAITVDLLICVGFLLGASALLRRPGIAMPGLLGGLVVTVVTLALSGFTALDQVTYIPSFWQQWVIVIGLPALVGTTGTLWRGDPTAGRRIARLAALSAGLLHLLYANIAVAVIGSGGPPDPGGGGTVRGTVSERLGNNFVDMVFSTLFMAMVGWAAAALAGYLIRRRSTPHTPATEPVVEV